MDSNLENDSTDALNETAQSTKAGGEYRVCLPTCLSVSPCLSLDDPCPVCRWCWG